MSILKKIWDFLWNSNSLLSWIIDIILIFLIVKFLILPGIGLALGTPLPLVIIESGSMEHQGSFEYWFSNHGEWYLNNNISKEQVKSWNFNNGMDKGDIIVVKGLKNKDYKIGDVIVFNAPGYTTPIIHRIVLINNENGTRIFSTKGDHNNGQLPHEKSIRAEQIIGKAIFRVPKLGWIKLFFVGILK